MTKTTEAEKIAEKQRRRPNAPQRSAEAAADGVLVGLSLAGTDEQWSRCAHVILDAIASRFAVISKDLHHYYLEELARHGAIPEDPLRTARNGRAESVVD